MDRYKHSIKVAALMGRLPVRDGYRGDGRCTVQEAAKQLNVNISTIAAWCRSGRLDGIQAVPHGPWWIPLAPEVIASCGQPVRRRWSRRPGT